MFPEKPITAVQQATEVMAQALSEFAEIYKTLEELAYKIDAREEERGRWGNQPKALVAAYTQPAKKIRPCARSFGRR